MGFAFAVFKKELQLRWRDPFAFLLWLLIPLVIGGLITSFSGGSDGPTPTAKLLIVDLDGSFVSGLVNTAFQQDQLSGLIKAQTVTETEGRALMADGNASALLIIPAGFGDAVINETPTTLQLLTNPSQRILPGIIEEMLGMLTDAIFYAQQVFGSEIRQIMSETGSSGAPENAVVAAITTNINEKIARVSSYVFPPVITIEAVPPENITEQSSGPSFALLFFPGIILMALMFFAQSAGDTFWQEREQQTLSRNATTPNSLGMLLLGKVAAIALLSGISVSILFVPGFAYHGLSIDLVPLSLLFCMISGSVLFLGLSLIQLFSPSRQAGTMISFLLVFPLLMLGGSFFPTEAMPGWMAAIGRASPNGYMVETLKQYFIGTTTNGDIAQATVIFSGIAFLLTLVAGWRLNQHFAREK